MQYQSLRGIGYEQEGQKIQLEVFSDRVMISSPGVLPKPLTLTKIRTGNYRAISRNPLIAHGLSFFHRIEERGSGFGRMNEVMKVHGLDEPLLSTNSGCFEITFPGPGDDLERIRVPRGAMELAIDPSVEAKLSTRQREMLELMRQGKELTSRFCEDHLGVTRDSTSRDFKMLVDLNLAIKIGAGRSTRYVHASHS